MRFLNGVLLTALILLSSSGFSQVIADTTDLGITATVNSKLAANPALSSTHIQVSTTNGVVNLAGILSNENQAAIAAENAQATPGVKDVEVSQLQVNGNYLSSLSDALITAKIKGLFVQEKLFGDSLNDQEVSELPIKVETNDGVVTLSGRADNPKQMNAAIKLSQSISGVRQVRSTIKVPTLSNVPADSLS